MLHIHEYYRKEGSLNGVMRKQQNKDIITDDTDLINNNSTQYMKSKFLQPTL